MGKIDNIEGIYRAGVYGCIITELEQSEDPNSTLFGTLVFDQFKEVETDSCECGVKND